MAIGPQFFLDKTEYKTVIQGESFQALGGMTNALQSAHSLSETLCSNCKCDQKREPHSDQTSLNSLFRASLADCLLVKFGLASNQCLLGGDMDRTFYADADPQIWNAFETSQLLGTKRDNNNFPNLSEVGL